MSTGGTPVGSDYDYTTGHLKTFFAFMGITDTEVIAADGVMGPDADEKIAYANEQVAAVA